MELLTTEEVFDPDDVRKLLREENAVIKQDNNCKTSYTENPANLR